MSNLYTALAFSVASLAVIQKGFTDPQPERARLTGIWDAPISVMLPAPHGQIQALIRRTHVICTDSSGFSRRLPVQVVIVPSKKLYWVGLPSGVTYFVLEDSIVAVRPQISERLFFYPSTDHMSVADDEGAIQGTLSSTAANFASAHLEYNPIAIKLESYLGFFSLVAAPTSFPPAPVIDSVAVSENSFSVNLSGAQDRKKKAVVTFSDDFTVTGATIMGKKVYPH